MNHSYGCKVHECGETFTSRSEAVKHAKKHAGNVKNFPLLKKRLSIF